MSARLPFRHSSLVLFLPHFHSLFVSPCVYTQIDNNIRGMDFVHFSTVSFRRPLPAFPPSRAAWLCAANGCSLSQHRCPNAHLFKQIAKQGLLLEDIDMNGTTSTTNNSNQSTNLRHNNEESKTPSLLDGQMNNQPYDKSAGNMSSVNQVLPEPVPEEDIWTRVWTESNTPMHLLSSRLARRVTWCELEVDADVSDILNRLRIVVPPQPPSLPTFAKSPFGPRITHHPSSGIKRTKSDVSTGTTLSSSPSGNEDNASLRMSDPSSTTSSSPSVTRLPSSTTTSSSPVSNTKYRLPSMSALAPTALSQGGLSKTRRLVGSLQDIKGTFALFSTSLYSSLVSHYLFPPSHSCGVVSVIRTLGYYSSPFSLL